MDAARMDAVADSVDFQVFAFQVAGQPVLGHWDAGQNQAVGGQRSLFAVAQVDQRRATCPTIP